MKRKILLIVLVISILLNLFFGIKSLKDHRKYSKLTEDNFYQSTILLYNVFEDLDFDFFKSKDANLNDAKYINEIRRLRLDKLHPINEILYNISEFDHSGEIGPFFSYEIHEYLLALSDYAEKNGNIPEKEITILKEIIRKVKLIGIYGEAAKNYNPKFDPVSPKTRIYNELKEIEKLVKEGAVRVQSLK